MNRAELVSALERLCPSLSTMGLGGTDCFWFKGDEVRAADGMTMACVRLKADTGLDCTVPGAKLYGLLSGMSEDEVELAADDESLRVKTDRVRATYKTRPDPGMLDELDFDVAEWLPVPKDMLEGLKLCRFAASRGRGISHGAMCGVHVHGKTVQATDGYRLAWMTCENELSADPVVIPPELMAAVLKYPDDVDGWAVKDGAVYFKFKTADTVMAGKTLAGSFPDTVELRENASKLGNTLKFPDGTAAALNKHIAHLKDVAIDATATVSVGPDGLTLTSSDSLVYTLEETLAMDGGAVEASFRIAPNLLKDILDRTETMHYGDPLKILAFKVGCFNYITSASVPEK